MSEWLMSSKVAEAERYLKTYVRNGLESRISWNQIVYQSLMCFPWLCNRRSQTMRGKSFHAGKAGGNLPAD